LHIVYAEKEGKYVELTRKEDKRDAESFKACIEECERLAGYEVKVKEVK